MQDVYYSALMRDLVAWRKGEAIDPDSGMPHLWHVITNVGFLITLDLKEDEKAFNSDQQQMSAGRLLKELNDES